MILESVEEFTGLPYTCMGHHRSKATVVDSDPEFRAWTPKASANGETRKESGSRSAMLRDEP